MQFSPSIQTYDERKALCRHLEAFDRQAREPGRHGDAKPVRLLEILALRKADRVTGACQVSYAELRHATGWARSTVIEAAAWLLEHGIIERHYQSGRGPYGCGANAWTFADPREVFRRLFPSHRVRETDPNLLSKKIPSYGRWLENRRGRKEVLLGEVEPEPATSPMGDAQWQGACEAAARLAGKTDLEGDAVEDGPLLQTERGALPLVAESGDEVLFPCGQERIATGEVKQGRQPFLGETRAPVQHIEGPGALGNIRRIGDFAQIIHAWFHGRPSPGCAAEANQGRRIGQAPPGTS